MLVYFVYFFVCLWICLIKAKNILDIFGTFVRSIFIKNIFVKNVSISTKLFDIS